MAKPSQVLKPTWWRLHCPVGIHPMWCGRIWQNGKDPRAHDPAVIRTWMNSGCLNNQLRAEPPGLTSGTLLRPKIFKSCRAISESWPSKALTREMSWCFSRWVPAQRSCSCLSERWGYCIQILLTCGPLRHKNRSPCGKTHLQSRTRNGPAVLKPIGKRNALPETRKGSWS